ncbi:MAG: aldo/keto reductase [Verrucomicrobiota bacterium]
MPAETLPVNSLGTTRFPVSRIGFGAWPIGQDWGEEVPEKAAHQTLHAALDAGMNFIDTADIYGAGRSERLIGEVLRDRSERIYVATKMGRDEDWEDTAEAIEKAAVGSLKRLGLETLDLVQLHCIPSDVLRRGEVFEGLEKIRKKGLIRHYGASVESIEDALHCIRFSGCAALQVIFNLFRQRVIRDLLPAAEVNHVGIIARVPLASGVLCGKFQPDHQFHEEDHRRYNANGEFFNVGETFAGVPFHEGIERALEAAALMESSSPEASLGQKALRWILDHRAISTVIPGARTPEQSQQNAEAARLERLGATTHEALSDWYWDKVDRSVRGVY